MVSYANPWHRIAQSVESVSIGEEWNEISTRVVILERIRICELLAISNVEVQMQSIGKRTSWNFQTKKTL